MQVNSANWNANTSNKIKTYVPESNIISDNQTNVDLKKKKKSIQKEEDYFTPTSKSLLQGIFSQVALKNLFRGKQ